MKIYFIYKITWEVTFTVIDLRRHINGKRKLDIISEWKKCTYVLYPDFGSIGEDLQTSASIFWIFKKSFRSRKFRMERWNYVNWFYNIRSFIFDLTYWGKKTFLSQNKKWKHSKYICPSNKTIRLSSSNIKPSNTRTNGRYIAPLDNKF